jgi:hypothetical protein
VFWSFYFMILNLNCEIYDSTIFGGIDIYVCNFGRQISKPTVFCRHAIRVMPTRCLTMPTRVIRATCVVATVSRSVSCPPFRFVPCRAVPNFLKAGHDTVKTRTRNSTVPVHVSCLNPFRFQPCSYRSVPFPATACLNLEH